MDNEIGIKRINEDANYSSPWIRFFVRVFESFHVSLQCLFLFGKLRCLNPFLDHVSRCLTLRPPNWYSYG